MDKDKILKAFMEYMFYIHIRRKKRGASTYTYPSLCLRVGEKCGKYRKNFINIIRYYLDRNKIKYHTYCKIDKRIYITDKGSIRKLCQILDLKELTGYKELKKLIR